jgi:hypothetical protein
MYILKIITLVPGPTLICYEEALKICGYVRSLHLRQRGREGPVRSVQLAAVDLGDGLDHDGRGKKPLPAFVSGGAQQAVKHHKVGQLNKGFC